MITINRWYRMSNDSSRKTFIDIIRKLYPNCKASIKVNYADCLKYNSDTNTLCYKTKYIERYHSGMEVYTGGPITIDIDLNKKGELNMTTNIDIKEELNMTTNIIENSILTKLSNPILSNYFNTKRLEAKEKYYNKRKELIETSKVGKAAKAYIKECLAVCGKAPNIDEMVTEDMLSNVDKEILEEEYKNMMLSLNKLIDKYHEVSYLISIADTYEQKENIYIKYGILNNQDNQDN